MKEGCKERGEEIVKGRQKRKKKVRLGENEGDGWEREDAARQTEGQGRKNVG